MDRQNQFETVGNSRGQGGPKPKARDPRGGRLNWTDSLVQRMAKKCKLDPTREAGGECEARDTPAMINIKQLR
jgi:hypothetical protein